MKFCVAKPRLGAPNSYLAREIPRSYTRFVADTTTKRFADAFTVIFKHRPLVFRNLPQIRFLASTKDSPRSPELISAASRSHHLLTRNKLTPCSKPSFSRLSMTAIFFAVFYTVTFFPPTRFGFLTLIGYADFALFFLLDRNYR